MKTLIINTNLVKEAGEVINLVVNRTHNKVISAADVWNIQRNKKMMLQRRIAL